MTNNTTANIGIVTVSDRASRGEYEDRGGPAIREYFDAVLTSPWTAVTRVIPDDQPIIEETPMKVTANSHNVWACPEPGAAWGRALRRG